MINIHTLPAFSDNYIWLIEFGDHQAAVVDPGDANVVLQALEEHELNLTAILITHEHWDHVDGIEGLLAQHAVPVFGPENGNIPNLSNPVTESDKINLGELEFEVLETPGHTADHIAYVGHNVIFTGDTLFAAGCGRLVGGKAEQLHNSLKKIAELPIDTSVYCTHEYTLSNLHFAQAVEPDNKQIQQRQKAEEKKRQRGEPTVPSTLELELATNPFLRCHEATVKNNAEQFAGKSLESDADVFKTLRYWKDTFT